MAPITRQFLTCIVSYVTGLVLATAALLGSVDLTTVGLGQWSADGCNADANDCGRRILGSVPLHSMRTFLFGGIAIYSLLYLCGRLVANAFMSNQGATIVGALALFVLAFMMIRTSADGDI